MVAELRAVADAPVLLYEPDEERPGAGHTPGWQRVYSGRRYVSEWTMQRRHADDAWGLAVQRIIVRYYLTRVTRAELAAELAVSERVVQSYVRCETWGSYGRPVLRALRRLGIGPQRGQWWTADGRSTEVITAQRAVMRRAIDCLEGSPRALADLDEVLADLRLLTLAPDGDS